MKFSTMIPMHYNDGESVDPYRLADCYRMFWKQYGGCTIDAVADGFWFNEKEQKLYIDKVRRLTVVTPSGSQAQLDYARMLVRKVGVFLKQKCMYFEHDANLRLEVEFLNVDPDETFDLDETLWEMVKKRPT